MKCILELFRKNTLKCTVLKFTTLFGGGFSPICCHMTNSDISRCWALKLNVPKLVGPIC